LCRLVLADVADSCGLEHIDHRAHIWATVAVAGE
jgi:hypothetical protein